MLFHWKIGPVVVSTSSIGLAVLAISASLLYLLLRPSLGRIEVFSVVPGTQARRQAVLHKVAHVALMVAWISTLLFVIWTVTGR